MNKDAKVVIATNQLCKSYTTGNVATHVLRDVTFNVHRGECVYLMGPSGSGKTTLLSILGCVLTADSGDIRLLDEDITSLSPSGQARMRREAIGFVFQRFHLFSALDAHDNVRLPMQLLGWGNDQAKRRANELLELVGLGHKQHARLSQLSMGQRQRVAVARALAGNPSLILADEPTASLDEASGRQAMLALKELCHELGKTVVVVTHDPRIADLADRILTMRDGCLAPASSTVDRPSKVALAGRSLGGDNECDR